MKLILATNNAHKVREIRQILGGKFEEIIPLKEAGIVHETVEDGTTFAENAIKKAREIAEISGCCALADDSGICVNALGGAPGIFSARYSGEHGDDEANNRLLLKNLEGKTDRSAYFFCSVALVYPDGKVLLAEGKMDGEILHEPVGENGFGYDPIFRPVGYSCSSAELLPEEKNGISHRGKALEEMMRLLNEK